MQKSIGNTYIIMQTVIDFNQIWCLESNIITLLKLIKYKISY